jgi:L-methionine (R)-S-oxide reductase
MELLRELKALLEDETDMIANAANMSALIYQNIPNLNWVGFYFLNGNELVLGPFQGKVACTRIMLGKGVCGTAFKEKKVFNVPDVHLFEGHIACDSASRSELVVPLYKGSLGIGVLDVDSPLVNRFDSYLEGVLRESGELFLGRI